MSWTDAEQECYPSGLETPYWVIGIGFITSLFINSFILFSGQSLTTKIWNALIRCIRKYFCRCLSSNNDLNPPPNETQLDVKHASICAFWCCTCCHRVSYFCLCCRKNKEKQLQKPIKFPKIIKLSVNKNKAVNIHDTYEDIYENEDEYDEEFESSMIAYRAESIDISIPEMLLNEDDDINDAYSHLIAKHDVSLTGSEISGYYKLLKRKKDIANYGYPVYKSNHLSLVCILFCDSFVFRVVN